MTNHEGYADPTAEKAIRNIEKEMERKRKKGNHAVECQESVPVRGMQQACREGESVLQKARAHGK